MKFHTGYKLDKNDYHDVKALCQRFGIKMPLEYEAFEITLKEEANELERSRREKS